jgi:hypothetical protein
VDLTHCKSTTYPVGAYFGQSPGDGGDTGRGTSQIVPFQDHKMSSHRGRRADIPAFRVLGCCCVALAKFLNFSGP